MLKWEKSLGTSAGKMPFLLSLEETNLACQQAKEY